MKKLYMITRKDCPYCKEAEKNLNMVLRKYPLPRNISLEVMAEAGEEWDHFYTPAFYLEKEKIAEGEYTEEAILKILKEVYALNGDG